MSRFNSKRITDAVHGTIGLSQLEARIIDTRAFQRLRNVKQLGLAYYVFPGAGYSRFAHSLGVCHVTGRILEALRDSGVKIEDDEYQLYRIAALLHDVGHYPFSHSMEEAVDNFYKNSLLIPKSPQAANATTSNSSAPNPPDSKPAFTQSVSLHHESVGKEILLNDAELRQVIGGFRDPKEIYAIFKREKNSLYGNIVSSDLDADRTDYMLRTAHQTGLPYGSVDLGYLLSQIRLDDENRVCLTAKALRTADHFLLSRYFDYQQVPFHKTVTAFELVLKDVIYALLQNGEIKCSAQDVKDAIENRQWGEFDDDHIVQKIRTLYESASASSSMKAKARSILYRSSPKLLGEVEYIGERGEESRQLFRTYQQLLRERLDTWAQKFSISRDLWYLWEPAALTLTKISPFIPVSSLESSDSSGKGKYEQIVRILNTSGSSSSPIIELRHSLMSVLAKHALYALRVYVLFPEGQESRRREMSDYVRSDLHTLPWK